MNIKLKFGLGAKVVVPQVGSIGEICEVRIYRDGSKQVSVRWLQADGQLVSNWFTEKELKTPKPEKKIKAFKKPIHTPLIPKPVKKRTVQKNPKRPRAHRGGW